MKHNSYSTVRDQGFLHCSVCHKLFRTYNTEPARCPRCESTVYSRIPHSLSQTWALLITSIILFIPANILPVMTVEKLGSSKADTIFSGIVNLMNSGMLPIAAIIFIASILVPLFKMLILFYLLFSVQLKWKFNIRQRMLLYRLIDFVGRWSMLDIFVIAILITLVSFGKIISIYAGPAATAFTAVVILTMIAAMRFDSRLMWDVLKDD